jgi:hypothetical protein
VCSLLTIGELLEAKRVLLDYEETRCTVLDRRLFPQTSTVASRGSGRSRTSTSWAPHLALRYDTNEGERISEGFAAGLTNAGDLRDFAFGQDYACWYDPEAPRRVVVRRNLGPAWFGLMMLPMLFALGALVVIFVELREWPPPDPTATTPLGKED